MNADAFACLIGIQHINAGSKNIVKTQMPTMPAATMFPSCLKGGEIEKLSDKKPIAVVNTATEIAKP